jgi:hypothetical protein
MAAPAVAMPLRALVLAAGLYAVAAHGPGGSATGLPACRPARRHPLDGALRRGLAGERHPAQRAHRPVAVVPQRRRPVAPLRHARRRLRWPAAGDARHAAHAHRRGPGPDQPRLPQAPLHRRVRPAGPVPQPRHRRRDPEGAAHPGEDWLLAIGRYHRPAGGEPAARYRRSVSRHLARVQGTRPTAAVLAARQETSP